VTSYSIIVDEEELQSLLVPVPAIQIKKHVTTSTRYIGPHLSGLIAVQSEKQSQRLPGFNLVSKMEIRSVPSQSVQRPERGPCTGDLRSFRKQASQQASEIPPFLNQSMFVCISLEATSAPRISARAVFLYYKRSRGGQSAKRGTPNPGEPTSCIKSLSLIYYLRWVYS
jgi:hypothetical protein